MHNTNSKFNDGFYQANILRNFLQCLKIFFVLTQSISKVVHKTLSNSKNAIIC